MSKTNILADKILQKLTEEEIDFITEQALETKPSRIKQTKNFKKRENKRKHRFDDDY